MVTAWNGGLACNNQRKASTIAVISPVLLDPICAPIYSGESLDVDTSPYEVNALRRGTTNPQPAGVLAVLYLFSLHEPSVYILTLFI